MGGIFINYRTADSAFGAVMLDQKLVERFGESAVFRDNRSLSLGNKFEPVLWKRLRSSDIVIVVIGPHWLSEATRGGRRIDDPEDFVHREIVEALRLDLDIVPVLIGDTPLPKPEHLPPALRSLPGYQYVSIRARDPESDIDRLVNQLAGLPALAALASHSASPQPAGVDGNQHSVHTHVDTVHGENIVFGFQNRG
ncbi:TIR domain-containing protein [Micromonospora chersina]|uniref:TIR domain-containing protein n=1 Tax=Micromonospora chersina TaxID=47854 RepID=A0A1C6U9V6_9ACTN|nr:TIR domain-containing protein [Micromonospora chersina]